MDKLEKIKVCIEYLEELQKRDLSYDIHLFVQCQIDDLKHDMAMMEFSECLLKNIDVNKIMMDYVETFKKKNDELYLCPTCGEHCFGTCIPG